MGTLACEGDDGRPESPVAKTLWKLAQEQPELSRYVSLAGRIPAVQQALEDNQVTLSPFAPSDAAFAAMPGVGTLDDAALLELLRFHMFTGYIDEPLLAIGGDFDTVSGTTVRVDVSTGTPSLFRLVDGRGGRGTLTKVGLPASNGALSVIDRVLSLPRGMALDCSGENPPAGCGACGGADCVALTLEWQVNTGLAADSCGAGWRVTIDAGSVRRTALCTDGVVFLSIPRATTELVGTLHDATNTELDQVRVPLVIGDLPLRRGIGFSVTENIFLTWTINGQVNNCPSEAGVPGGQVIVYTTRGPPMTRVACTAGSLEIEAPLGEVRLSAELTTAAGVIGSTPEDATVTLTNGMTGVANLAITCATCP